MTVPKTDLKKVHRSLYTATANPGLVEAPELPFLMIDGRGDPDGDGYRRAVEALYGVAYAVRFALKKAEVLEYPVMPLQGLWWPDEGREFSYDLTRDAWCWTMMILQPAEATAEVVQEALTTAAKKKPGLPVPDVRAERLHEGPCAQILHTGPFATEPATLTRLYGFLDEKGLAIAGRHHEIYLSNPHRTAPEKMRTILRYPVTLPSA
ncbi:GyrI-like domain-containing protein [Actinocorallia sp. B10E7]|uniref:GyrI-like domain-containing protein n=1 Tax=Actinocorallia sp. B10E7 TaxID=3153558 RepID=UPI00325F67C3